MSTRIILALGLAVCWLALPVPARAEQAEPDAPEQEPAGEDDRTLVAVLFLATGPVDAGLADNLTEVLVATVASAGSFTIVGREQFGAALGFGGEERTAECAEDPLCLGRIATVIGAEEVVVGSVGLRAGRYLVNLSRIDVGLARAVHRVFRATRAELGPLLAAVGEGARELMRPPPAALRVTVNVPEAVVTVDGEALEPDPDGVYRGLEPGRHLLVVSAEEHEEVAREVELERGVTTELAVGLSRVAEAVAVERPWHSRWWVWTLVGVALAGAGAATAAVLLTAEPDRITGSLGRVEVP